jgi:hypothetical protein
MSTLDWLDENEHRNYPFTVDATAGQWLYSLVDADVVLGADFAFDLDQDDAIVLVDISLSGAGTAAQYSSTWSFRHIRDGVQVADSPVLTVAVPANPARHSTWRGSSPGGQSSIKITIGDAAGVTATGAVVCPLEDRTVRVYGAAATQTIRVFNTVRPESYKPYFVSSPIKSAAQNYLDAVANSPYGGVKTNTLVTAPGDLVTGAVVFAPGNNAVVQGNSVAQSISISLEPGAGEGRDCTTPAPGQGYAGTVRAINGQGGTRGDLSLVAGSGFEIVTNQDNFSVTIKLKALSDAQGCGKAIEQKEPSAIPDPP